jgi:hypothetical protein
LIFSFGLAATEDAQLALLPTAGGSSAPTAAPAATVPVD